MDLSCILFVVVLTILPELAYGGVHIPVTGLETGISPDGQRPKRLNINTVQAYGGPPW
jgi:hypothetical protein